MSFLISGSFKSKFFINSFPQNIDQVCLESMSLRISIKNLSKAKIELDNLKNLVESSNKNFENDVYHRTNFTTSKVNNIILEDFKNSETNPFLQTPITLISV